MLIYGQQPDKFAPNFANFFMKKIGRARDFRKRLDEACAGLIYISETDAEVEPFFGAESGEVTPQKIFPFIDFAKRNEVEEIDCEQFFDKLTGNRDWFGADEKKRAKQFASLHSLLKENVTGLKVFRFGKIRIDIFVVGIDKEKRLAGVRTRAVET